MRFCGFECQKAGWQRHRSLCPSALKTQLCLPKYLRVYPNVGALYGEILVDVRHLTERQAREALAEVVFRDSRPVRLFAEGQEVLEGQFWQQSKGLVVAAEPHGLREPMAPGPKHEARARRGWRVVLL